MEVHHHIRTPRKMDPLFLGVPYVIPRGILLIFGQIQETHRRGIRSHEQRAVELMEALRKAYQPK